MNAYDAILTRRSVRKVGTRVPDRASVERLLEAGVRAPTHHLTQPWRFIVLRGDAIDGFGEAWAAGVERLGKDPEDARAKARRAPVVICVLSQPKSHLPRVVEVEEHYAVGALLENILLAAHATGLGAMLRTGPAAVMQEVRDYLGVEEGEVIAGFIYLGYPSDPDSQPVLTRRRPPAEITQWRGWDR